MVIWLGPIDEAMAKAWLGQWNCRRTGPKPRGVCWRKQNLACKILEGAWKVESLCSAGRVQGG
jgi:hypothetical protein